MMHLAENVVALVDGNRKPFREYEPEKSDKGRKAKVLIPFESEYQFLIKNLSDRRICLEIEIDGTVVSGNGFIVNAHDTQYLERFLDSAKKFKFVKTSHEAVSDPTSRENGLIKVRVSKEKKVVAPITKIVEEHHHHHYDWSKHWPWYPHNTHWYGGSFGGPLYGSAGLNVPTNENFSCYNATEKGNYAAGGAGLNDSTPAVNCVHSSIQAQSVVQGETYTSGAIPVGEAGATIEGGVSHQSFVSTTWAGDEEVSHFTFLVSGVEKPIDPEYETYMKLKEKFEKK